MYGWEKRERHLWCVRGCVGKSYKFNSFVYNIRIRWQYMYVLIVRRIVYINMCISCGRRRRSKRKWRKNFISNAIFKRLIPFFISFFVIIIAVIIVVVISIIINSHYHTKQSDADKTKQSQSHSHWTFFVWKKTAPAVDWVWREIRFHLIWETFWIKSFFPFPLFDGYSLIFFPIMTSSSSACVCLDYFSLAIWYEKVTRFEFDMEFTRRACSWRLNLLILINFSF